MDLLAVYDSSSTNTAADNSSSEYGSEDDSDGKDNNLPIEATATDDESFAAADDDDKQKKSELLTKHNNKRRRQTATKRHEQVQEAEKNRRQKEIYFIIAKETNKQQQEHDNHHQQQLTNSAMLTNKRQRRFARTVPHIPGNWAGHIFISLQNCCKNSGSSFCILQKFQDDCVQQFQTWLEDHSGVVGRITFRPNAPPSPSINNTSTTSKKNKNVPSFKTTATTTMHVIQQHSCLELHISLSRYFALQLASIDSFVAALRKRLQYTDPFTIAIETLTKPTTIETNTTTITQRKNNNDNTTSTTNNCCCIMINDEQTRSFLAWPVVTQEEAAIANNHPLKQLVEHIDEVLRQYRQPIFYPNPFFHVSIASVAGAIIDEDGVCSGVRNDDENGNDKNNNKIIFPLFRLTTTSLRRTQKNHDGDTTDGAFIGDAAATSRVLCSDRRRSSSPAATANAPLLYFRVDQIQCTFGGATAKHCSIRLGGA